ncbi:MAG: hypothetical protein ACR2RB_09955 [Gammaproteobacteria bacterium]
MARTTINIDEPIMQELKRLQRATHRPLGALVSELLSEGLSRRRNSNPAPPPFHWNAKSMQAHVDLADKEALQSLLDEEDAY